jgi:hypothetical protein
VELVAELPVKSSSSIAVRTPSLVSLRAFIRNLARRGRKYDLQHSSIALTAIGNDVKPSLQDQEVTAAEDGVSINPHPREVADGPAAKQNSRQTSDEVGSQYLKLYSSSELGRAVVPVSISRNEQLLGPQPPSVQVRVTGADPISESTKSIEIFQQLTVL